jgi:hypothetical protein
MLSGHGFAVFGFGYRTLGFYTLFISLPFLCSTFVSFPFFLLFIWSSPDDETVLVRLGKGLVSPSSVQQFPNGQVVLMGIAAL